MSALRQQEPDEGGLEGFVYQVPGPDGQEQRWIARSTLGHVAHGRTSLEAAQSLRLGMEALAEASGMAFAEWRRSQRGDGSCFLKAGELVRLGPSPS